MGDRHRYGRPSSPRLYDPMRSSLPSVGHSGHYGEMHAIPTRREVITTPRTSIDRVHHVPGPITTTTYKITQEPATRSSSNRTGSRTRSSTVDSIAKPAVTVVPKHRPTVHHGGSGRPGSPLNNPYRSSDEGDYLAIPSSSGKHRGHRRMYSATMDNGDHLRRIAGHESQGYPVSRSRPAAYAGPTVRHPDTLAEDYGADGYGYTKSGDLLVYDLNHTPRYTHRTRDNSQTRARPSSVGGYQDIASRSFDNRERGPPPSTRGFDRMQTRSTFDQAPIRSPVTVEPVSRPRASSRTRPVSVFQEREPQRQHHTEDYYDPRDSDSRDRRERLSRHDRYDDGPDRGHTSRSEKKHDDRSDKMSGRDALAAGLSIAASALGLGAVASSGTAKDEERDERDDYRRRKDETDDERRRRRDAREPREESDEEKRRRRDRDHRDESDEERRRRRDREHRDERQPVEQSGREASDRYRRDERAPVDVSRESHDPRPRRDERDHVDVGPRGSRENVSVRDDRGPSDDHSRHERYRNIAEPPATGRNDHREESPVSVDSQGRPRRERILPPAAFNPRDTMDIRALKDALNAQDSRGKEPDLIPVASSRDAAFDPRDPRDLRNMQVELNARDDRPRRQSITPPDQNRELRVVSPPRDKPEEKPVKGILRQPRDKFPEDPSPIREGVAPLKDAKKDGVPAEARWTKISRKLVSPAALELNKERYEARDDFVIVLRVLNREEVQQFATITQQIRSS